MTVVAVRSLAEERLKQLELLVRIHEDVCAYDNPDDVYSTGLSPDDQLTRFRIWAANIGAMAEAHASLDYRLRDNRAAKQLMVDFLGTLGEFLERAIESLKPDQMQLYDVNDSPIGHLEQSVSSIVSSSFHGTETGSAVMEEVDSASPFEQRMQGVEKTIDRLYRLSLMIRRPSIAGQNSKAEKVPIIDDDGNNIDQQFLDFALRLATHQFPDTTYTLKDRLARGIVIRRKRFLYRRSHQRRLSTNTVVVQKQDQTYGAGVGACSDYELASTVKGIRIAVIDTGATADDGDGFPRIRKLPTQTSATTMTKSPISMEQVIDDEESRQSTSFTNTLTRSTPMIVPDPPRPSKGSKEFECPYCCMMLPISQAKASRWRKHVLADLEPYVCVFEGCTDAHMFFRDREAWASHMRTSHTTRWVCTSLAHETYSSNTEEEFNEHMWAMHKGSFTESQLPLLSRRSKVPTTVLFRQCPLCGWPATGVEREKLATRRDSNHVSQAELDKLVSDLIVKHLASHLEAVSARSLPWNEYVEDAIEETAESKIADEGTAQSEDDPGSAHGMNSDSLPTPGHEQGQARSASWPAFDESNANYTPAGSYEQDWGFIPLPEYYGHDRDPILQTLLCKLYLEMSPFSSDCHGPKLPAYLVPIDRDKNFFARSHDLDMIRENLLPDPELEQSGAKPPTYPRCFAVHGPGGMGKTQIAAQFVASHRDKFDAVLWAHAEDTSRLSQDFKDMAISLGLISESAPDATDLSFTRDILKRWLVKPTKSVEGAAKSRDEKASWLLVFDGVVNGDDLNEFWPYDGPGSILITSRNPHSWIRSLELEPFSVQEATDYLMHRTGREVSHHERSSAMAVAERLGGLPLALAQMGSIIVHKSIPFSTFLSSYEGKEGQLILLQWPSHEGRQDLSNYEHNVASVWAFDSLGQGASLLNVLSMLDPDGIPENLFASESSTNAGAELTHMKTEYRSARNELLSRSLVTKNKREKKLFIHRLVQDVARSRMASSELRHVFVMTVKLVASKWPFEIFTWRHGNDRWATCEELFPHIQKLKDHFLEITPSTDVFEDFEFARLLVDTGWYRHERGRSADAILFSSMAQSICESLKLRLLEDPEYAADTSLTLSTVNYTLTEICHNRGCIALEVNDPENALRYHQLFNKMMTKELGNKTTHEDMRLAISWNELGNAYMLNQEWSMGEEYFLKSVAEMRRLKDFHPVQVSLPLANLGLAYWLQKKYELASETLLKGLKDREEKFGPDDRISFITGRFLHGLGNVRESQGLLEESLSYHRRALQHYKATLGNRHHRTADVFVKVAEHQIRMQQYETALALLDHALEAYSGSSDYKQESMRALFKRARALQALERNDEADYELSRCFALYRPIMREKIRVLGDRAGEMKVTQTELIDADVDCSVLFWSR